MQANALQVVEQDGSVVALPPEQQVEKAAEMAKVLQRVVRQGDLAKKFGGQKEHLQYEAWQTIGQFFNCTPITEWTKPIKEADKIIGWESRVKIVNIDGREIAAAESMCMKDEPNWRNKPQYAIRSMSQTRAGGKAFRSVFAWVAVLAGYSATPAEEMDSSFNDEPKKTKPKSVDSSAWTDAQRKKLWAMCKSHELTNKEATDFVDRFIPEKDKATASDAIEHFDELFQLFVGGNVDGDEKGSFETD